MDGDLCLSILFPNLSFQQRIQDSLLNLRLQKTWQLSLPEEFIEQLGIQDGSTLTCFLEDNELRIRPETLTQTAPESCSLPGKKTLKIKCFGNMSAILGTAVLPKHFLKSSRIFSYLSYYVSNVPDLMASASARNFSDFMIANPCPSSPRTTS